MQGLYLTSDLLFASRVGQASRRQGLEIQVVGSQQVLLEKSAAEDVSLVVLDLGRTGPDLQQLVADLRAHCEGTTIVAYGPHVDDATLASARSAGCDLVLTKGQFDREMNQVLANHLQ